MEKETNENLARLQDTKKRIRLWLAEYKFEPYYTVVNTFVVVSENPDKSLTLKDPEKFLLQHGTNLVDKRGGKKALKLKLNKDNMEEVWKLHRPQD